MSDLPDDLQYTATHEWLRRLPGLIEVGITDFAQHQLADITFVELPEPGAHLGAGEQAAVVESIKAAADVYAPVSGVVAEVNPGLADAPEKVNSDPYGQGWLFRMTPDESGGASELMDADEYRESLPEP